MSYTFGDYVGDDESYTSVTKSVSVPEFERGYRPTLSNALRRTLGKPQEESFVLEPIIQLLKNYKSHYGKSEDYEKRKNNIKNFSEELEDEVNFMPAQLSEARKYANDLKREIEGYTKNYGSAVLSHKLNFLLNPKIVLDPKNREAEKMDKLIYIATTPVEDVLKQMYGTNSQLTKDKLNTLASYKNPSKGGKRSRRNKTVRKSRRKGTRRLRK